MNRVIVEVGSGDGNNLKSEDFLGKKGYTVHLIEPNPLSFKYLEEKTKSISNVICHNICIFNKNDYVDFVVDNQWSYIKGIKSPCEVNFSSVGLSATDSQKGLLIKSKSIKICDLIKEDTEILYLDCEGSEGFVLKELCHRPNFISIPIMGVSGYRNEFSKEIDMWFMFNNYDQTGHTENDLLYKRRV